MSLGKQAAQGAAWNYAAFLVSKGLLFVATLILARLLTPEEFGLVGMALLVITVLEIFRDFGIGAALIYRQGEEEREAAANVAFWLSASIGIALFTLNWFLAPVTVQFFKTGNPARAELMATLLRVLGFSLLFASLGSTHDALLQKEINYRRRMVPEVGRTLVKGTLSVVLALIGWGVWSLVIGQVVGEGIATILLWATSKWRPRRVLDRSLLRPMAGYGSQIMMSNGLGTMVADIDYFIIARLLGEAALGLYTLAFRIPEMIISNLSRAVSAVAFPVAARLQADLPAMREAYLRMQHYMLLILAPLGFGLAAATPTIMHALFQARWDPAIPVMQLLSVYMVLGAISHWPGVVYKAVGRPGILNTLSFVKLSLLVPVLWTGAAIASIEGVAWGQVIVQSVGIAIDMVVIARFVNISVTSNLRAIWPPFGAAIVMALAMWAVMMLDSTLTSIPVLALAVMVGAVTYLGMVWLLDRRAVRGLVTLGTGVFRRRASVMRET
ncbi:MAG TPA: lipopolysaccharide biosynthesis protein [Chloroflexia bacterium]|nr:lipopolysaccharide biosynthesis protein [Chloroflexia bacterium]